MGPRGWRSVRPDPQPTLYQVWAADASVGAGVTGPFHQSTRTAWQRTRGRGKPQRTQRYTEKDGEDERTVVRTRGSTARACVKKRISLPPSSPSPLCTSVFSVVFLVPSSSARLFGWHRGV